MAEEEAKLIQCNSAQQRERNREMDGKSGWSCAADQWHKTDSNHRPLLPLSLSKTICVSVHIQRACIEVGTRERVD